MSSGCPATCAPFSVPSAFLDAQPADAAMRSPLEPCCDWGQSNLHFRLFRLWPKAALPECPLSRRCWGLSGHYLVSASLAIEVSLLPKPDQPRDILREHPAVQLFVVRTGGGF